MLERNRYRPFTGDTERRIRLSNPPLPLVLCQVRWPDLTQLQTGLDDAAGRVGAKLEGYPLHEQTREVAITLTPEGVTTGPGEVVHQWHSADKAWHVAMTRRSIAAFCTSYTSFDEFAHKLKSALDAVASTLDIPVIERVGVRYVNRITDPATLGTLESTLNPAVLGLAALRPSSSEVVRLTSLNQIVYSVGRDRLQVRSGLLAPGETVDPAVPPVTTSSWILDLDSFRESLGGFDSKEVIDVVGRLADINYDFFKLVATDQYLESVEGG